MRQRVKKGWLVLMTVAVLCILLASPAAAEDRYWINSAGGRWTEPPPMNPGMNWMNSAGEIGLPGIGDSALIVVPYSLSNPNYTQPILVNVIGLSSDPIDVGSVVIESGNILYQGTVSGPDYTANMTTGIEIIGGSGRTYDPPESYYVPDPPGIYPKGTHKQSAGMNFVNTELTLGNIAGSEGTYTLSGSGGLWVGSSEYVGKSGSGTFTQSGGTHSVGLASGGGALVLGENLTGTGSYTLSDGQLVVLGQEIVGKRGIGTFTQSGGANNMGSLILGQQGSGVGTYNLQQDAKLEVDGTVTIGSEGTGTLEQRGLSETTAGNLILAKEAGSFGTYEMEGKLTVASKAEIGRLGLGSFTQYGSLTINEGGNPDGGLRIGGSPATLFRMNEGLLKVYGNETIDKGMFQQINGYHYVFGTATAAGDLVIDSGDVFYEGSYVMVNGSLSVNNNIVVGNTGRGKFVLGDGTAEVKGGLYIGQSAGSFGTVEQSFGNLTTAFEQIGGLGAGRLSLSGGDHTVQYTLVVGGNMNADATITPGAGGVVKMTNGTLTVGNEILTNTTYAFDEGTYKSAFDQSGGTHTVQNKLKIESGANYELSGNGILSVATEELRGSFTHTGGTHTVAGDLTITGSLGPAGDYILGAGQQLSVGSLHNGGYIELGEGSSIKSVGGLIQNGNPDNPGGAFISSETGSGGLYGNATIKNYATIWVTGGDSDKKFFNVVGNIQNYPDAEIRIGGAGQSLLTGFNLQGNLSNYSDWRWTDPPLPTGYWQRGQILLDNALVVVDGDINNQGLMRLNYATLDWTGTLYVGIGGILDASRSSLIAPLRRLVLEGGLWTDPTTVRVGTMVVGETGYMKAMAGDRFFIDGDFINNSTQNTLWDTDLASLIFENAMSSMSHNFYLAGLDLGAIANGFLDNFAWGSLSLAAGDSLYLFDGNLDTPGAALYLGLITPMNFDFIFSDFNIYYNAMLPGNEWLAGGRYQLHGSGWLIPFIGGIEPPGPEPVPEPATMLLLGSGLIGLWGLRKKFRK